jgi:DNA repair exonuclease SbcCD ATPase subunit
VTILSKLPDTVPELVSSDALIKVGKVIKDTRIERERHRKVIDILSRVPEEIPVLIDSARHVGVIDRIERSTRELANAAARKNKAGTDVEACQKQLEELVESMGGACPLCGTHVDDAGAFFDRHDHANGGHTHA